MANLWKAKFKPFQITFEECQDPDSMLTRAGKGNFKEITCEIFRGCFWIG